MPQDKVLGLLGELENVLWVCIELEAQLLRRYLIIVLHVEVLVEEELISTHSGGIMPILLFLIVSIIAVVIRTTSTTKLVVLSKRVLLLNRVVVPDTSIDTNNRLPRCVLIGSNSLGRGCCCTKR